MYRKAGRLVRKHSRLSTVLATAVAAAGIGAIGASAGATPWVDAIHNLAMGDHAGSAPTGHSATSVFDAVIGQPAPAPQYTTGGLQLDSRDVSVPGFVGTLSNGAAPSGAGSAATPAASSLIPGTQQTHPAPAALPSLTPAPTGKAHAPVAAAHAAASHVIPAHVAPAHVAPAQVAKAHVAKAHVAKTHVAKAHAATARHARHAAPIKPYLIYDSVTPSSIPAHKNAAVYANGAYAASASDVAHRGHVLWIDTNGSDTNANVLDVEPGDATPAGAASWVHAKLSSDHKAIAIVYTMQSEWQAVKDNVAALPHWMQSHVRYWIADPTGVAHVVPGSNATQWYWGKNFDITTANPGFQS